MTFPNTGSAPTNGISAVNGTSYLYDANGNVINDGGHTYKYDSENRLVQTQDALGNLTNNILAAEYRLALPDPKDLEAEVEKTRRMLETPARRTERAE